MQLKGRPKGVLTGTHLPLGHSHGTRKALKKILSTPEISGCHRVREIRH
jgi:hypothetical protein